MARLLRRFSDDEAGATSIEYGLIIAFISIVIVSSVTSVGTVLITIFTSLLPGFVQ